VVAGDVPSILKKIYPLFQLQYMPCLEMSKAPVRSSTGKVLVMLSTPRTNSSFVYLPSGILNFGNKDALSAASIKKYDSFLGRAYSSPFSLVNLILLT